MHQNNKKIARDTHYKQWISVNLLKNNILRKNGTHDCRKQESFKESDRDKDLGDEMADVLWVLICLANQTGVDLTQALEKNFEKKTLRDKDRHVSNKKLKP